MATISQHSMMQSSCVTRPGTSTRTSHQGAASFPLALAQLSAQIPWLPLDLAAGNLCKQQATATTSTQSLAENGCRRWPAWHSERLGGA